MVQSAAMNVTGHLGWQWNPLGTKQFGFCFVGVAVFFMVGKLSGLIDFYFACNDATAYDIAVCLNAWCFEHDGAFNITKGRALLSTYRAIRPLSRAEVAALPILARGAAFRFLLTRLYDWINRDPSALVRPKDPLEYLTKLRFHQSAAGPQSYGWPE